MIMSKVDRDFSWEASQQADPPTSSDFDCTHTCTLPLLLPPVLQVTSHVSLYYWRQKYTELLPFMRESGVTPEEADDDECVRLLAEWNGAWCWRRGQRCGHADRLVSWVTAPIHSSIYGLNRSSSANRLTDWPHPTHTHTHTHTHTRTHTTGIIKDAVLKGREGRAWLKANTPIPRSTVLPTLKTGG
jgi:hypothetical protein